MNASIKFISGPANDTIVSPFSLETFEKLFGFICTGLPHPICANISKNIPTGSICFIGSNVSLPWFLGVGSPNLSAANAWANSWKDIASITPGNVNNVATILNVPIFTNVKAINTPIIIYNVFLSIPYISFVLSIDAFASNFA